MIVCDRCRAYIEKGYICDVYKDYELCPKCYELIRQVIKDFIDNRDFSYTIPSRIQK